MFRTTKTINDPKKLKKASQIYIKKVRQTKIQKLKNRKTQQAQQLKIVFL